MKKVTVFNGGGVKGLISLKLAKVYDNIFPNSLYCGTSTGAIIAAARSVGMTYDEIIEIYQQHMPNIFKGIWWSFGGIFCAKYDIKKLEKSIKEIFGEKTNKDCKTKLMINSYNITKNEPKYFKSWKEETFLLADAVIASCAAPTFFIPYTINCEQYVDGGVDMNLGLSAYVEANKLWKDEHIEIQIFGTGKYKKNLKINTGGMTEWASTITELFLDANDTSPIYILKQLIDSKDRFVTHDIYLKENILLDDVEKILRWYNEART